MGTTLLPKLLQHVKPSPVKNVDFKCLFTEHLCKQGKILSLPTKSLKNPSWVGGDRSYMLLGSLAKLEQALMNWSMDELIRKYDFTPVTVPNIIYDRIIESCGFPTSTARSQVYKLTGGNRSRKSLTEPSGDRDQSCIAGTSEFALAAIHIGDKIAHEELPKRYCALSRCYRAETSRSKSEWGLYRVHYFNKVEMFSFCMPDASGAMHDEFLSIQCDLFNQLGLEYQVLDMPKEDLGASASKKYDIEAWLSGRQSFGEISSTSNCEHYQSSRLNIKYSKMVEEDDQLKMESDFLHTVNGTACSSVRTILAICEQHQTASGRVDVPEPLRPYMNGVEHIPTDRDSHLLAEVDLYPETEQKDF